MPTMRTRSSRLASVSPSALLPDMTSTPYSRYHATVAQNARAASEKVASAKAPPWAAASNVATSRSKKPGSISSLSLQQPGYGGGIIGHLCFVDAMQAFHHELLFQPVVQLTVVESS